MKLGGKPLLAWSIQAALQCPGIARVAVDTDSPKIAAAAKKYGAEVLFLRPARLAGDKATSMDALRHFMARYDGRGEKFDAVAFLQPTSPLRNSGHIAQALQIFNQKKSSAVVSVTQASHPPHWTNHLPASLSLKDFLKNPRPAENKKFYTLNGAIYIAGWKYLLKNGSWFSKRSFAYIMDRAHSVDIDTIEDLWVAETFLYQLKKEFYGN